MSVDMNMIETVKKMSKIEQQKTVLSLSGQEKEIRYLSIECESYKAEPVLCSFHTARSMYKLKRDLLRKMEEEKKELLRKMEEQNKRHEEEKKKHSLLLLQLKQEKSKMEKKMKRMKHRK